MDAPTHPVFHPSTIYWSPTTHKTLSLETSIFFKNINTVKMKSFSNVFFFSQKRQFYQLLILFIFLFLGKPTDHCLCLNFTKLVKLGSFLVRSPYDKPTVVSIISPMGRQRVIYSINYPISFSISDTLSVR